MEVTECLEKNLPHVKGVAVVLDMISTDPKSAAGFIGADDMFMTLADELHAAHDELYEILKNEVKRKQTCIMRDGRSLETSL